ncbi:MAG: Smr/MutS family protein [Spirochaetaceae bacterium]|jgi:DNA-nicking Smr family endonuclease|nr:Smr/MutS family protein [Spirochaetaceae bacterium]
MDFGDILNAWDKQSGKGRTGNKAHGPLAEWLSENGVYDKDAGDSGPAENREARRRRLRAKKPDDTLDLHGLTQEEAWTQLESFFAAARRADFEKVLIIHGKGNHSAGDAVLKGLVRRYIEGCPFAGESGPGNASQGGAGATWVFLKVPSPAPESPETGSA